MIPVFLNVLRLALWPAHGLSWWLSPHVHLGRVSALVGSTVPCVLAQDTWCPCWSSVCCSVASWEDCPSLALGLSVPPWVLAVLGFMVLSHLGNIWLLPFPLVPLRSVFVYMLDCLMSHRPLMCSSGVFRFLKFSVCVSFWIVFCSRRSVFNSVQWNFRFW